MSFFHHCTRTYDDEGHLLADEEWDHWRNRYTEYFPSGRMKKTRKCTVVLGIHINRAVSIDYSEDGKYQVRTVDKAWTRTRVEQ
jgi:hypothetical protein